VSHRLRIFLAAVAIGSGACGYALVGRGSTLPEDVQTVFLRAFENRTQRTQIELILTRAVADELVTRKRLALASSPQAAQAEIRGTVSGFEVVPVSLDAGGRATQYEIVITAQVRLERLGGTPPEVLWQNDRYVFRRSYANDLSQAGYFDRENLAMEDAAKGFAETMVTDLLEGF
jgi:outer membrane lipopolysaccharide assembly protein LptE/RlpB